MKDLEAWAPLIGWIEKRLATPLTPRDLAAPLSMVTSVRPAEATADQDLPAAPLQPARRYDPPAGIS